MRHKLTNASGQVVNIIELDEDVEYTPPEGLMLMLAGEDDEITPQPPAPLPVPKSISDRQFFQQLAVIEIITEDEAIDAVAIGAVPSALQDFISNLPPTDRFPAKMIIKGATEFRRDHPLTAAIGGYNGMTEVDIDDFFRAASQL
jgi:hypothetical protein